MSPHPFKSPLVCPLRPFIVVDVCIGAESEIKEEEDE